MPDEIYRVYDKGNEEDGKDSRRRDLLARAYLLCGEVNRNENDREQSAVDYRQTRGLVGIVRSGKELCKENRFPTP